MASIKIFIASSRELSSERVELENEIGRIAEENRKAGVDIELVIWEKYSDYMTHTSKQDRYFRGIEECAVFICLIHSKIGRYTREELNLAMNNCKSGKHPQFIFVFFKDIGFRITEISRQDFDAVLDLKEHLEDQKQFPVFFDHIADLKLMIRKDLTRIIKENYGHKTPAQPVILPPRFLPRRTAGFTNRAAEIEKIIANLCKNEVVHIRGMGGIGKTELAIEISHRCIEKFDDGIIWHFAEKSQIDEVLNKILTAYKSDSFSMPLGEKKSIVQKILTGKKVLIILDNVEWDNRESVQEFINLAPDCAILITTRPHKGLLFDRSVLYDLDELAEKDAITLFEQKSSRSLSIHEKTHIAKIYKKLGGLPLAIELTARWAQSSQTNTAQLANWVNDNIISVFEENAKIKAIFKYTSDQMNEKEKEIFAILGVFNGETFSLEAVKTISAAKDVELILHKFIGLALVKIDKNRFQMHPILKFHAKELLPDDKVFIHRMMEYYLKFLASAKHLSSLDAEKDNIMGALDYAAANQMHENVLAFINYLTSPADAYYGYFAQRGYWEEGMRRAEQAIAICKRLKKTDSIAWYKTCLGLYHYWLGENDQARKLYKAAQEIFTKNQDYKGLIACLHQLGYIEDDENYYTRASAVYAKSLDLAQKINDRPLMALGYHLVGVAAYHQGLYDRAQQNIKKAIAIDSKLELVQAVARNKRRLAAVLRMKAHYSPKSRNSLLQQAFTCINEALLQETHVRNQARGNRQLGMLHEETGQLEKAQACYEKSLALFESIQNKKGIGSVKYNLGSVYEKTDRIQDAQKFYRESLVIAEQVKCRYGVACAWRQLGALAKKADNLHQARKALDKSVKIFAAIHSPFLREARHLRQKLDKKE